MSPLGSHENLHSPQSPDSQRNDLSRKNSLMTDSGIVNRRISVHDEGPDQKQFDMFKDMLSQKRNMIMSKLTSFDSDVSVNFDYSRLKVNLMFLRKKEKNNCLVRKLYLEQKFRKQKVVVINQN